MTPAAPNPLPRPTPAQTWASPAEFWAEVTTPGSDGSPAPWYRTAVGYWSEQEASDRGVLGGFDELTGVDIADSRAFLHKVLGPHISRTRESGGRLTAADCGAGIGRVAGGLLLEFFNGVDLVEPCGHLLDRARATLPHSPDQGKGENGGVSTAAPRTTRAATRVGTNGVTSNGATAGAIPDGHLITGFLQMGIQDFHPLPNTYDLVWIQWALLYLTDTDAVAFLSRCRDALTPGGAIIAKENVADGGFIVDTDDLSITRTHAYYLDLFDRAGLVLAASALQRGFPKGLYKVRLFALRAK